MTAGGAGPRAVRVATVRVGAAPEPHLLRAAIEAVLAGRPWAVGPERTVADAVRDAVHAGTGGGPPWH